MKIDGLLLFYFLNKKWVHVKPGWTNVSILGLSVVTVEAGLPTLITSNTHFCFITVNSNSHNNVRATIHQGQIYCHHMTYSVLTVYFF